LEHVYLGIIHPLPDALDDPQVQIAVAKQSASLSRMSFIAVAAAVATLAAATTFRKLVTMTRTIYFLISGYPDAHLGGADRPHFPGALEKNLDSWKDFFRYVFSVQDCPHRALGYLTRK
jgi:hypothetical protein